VDPGLLGILAGGFFGVFEMRRVAIDKSNIVRWMTLLNKACLMTVYSNEMDRKLHLLVDGDIGL
jgi:hypothetical protein